ncbi:MAG TPA: SGNH/GDSL hydrolase family protein, partial [Candidatus Handelsmanbacteria bacterium]|nr:SGNH/GDSL hydrolase family protein [Candidatus Handelsmanbacteria bacterium]
MPPDHAKILFVGNSFTMRNDLPALWAGLAATDGGGGTLLEWEVVAAGGASLRQHLNKGTAGLLLAEGGWDLVVLQEQSTLPVKNPKRTQENIRDFHGLIEEAGARTILYMTWARQNVTETQSTLAST